MYKRTEQCVQKMSVSLQKRDPDLQTENVSNLLKNFQVKYSWHHEQVVEVGDHISLIFLKKCQCMSCGKILTKYKAPFTGYCYLCFKTKASADFCILDPAQCHYEKGTCREPRWADNFCFTPHYVYLAFTDKYKVGITRQNQVPTRWCDQGATMAAVLCQVNSRLHSGLIEKKLSQLISDKSHWMRMLKMGNERPVVSEFLEKFQEIQGAVSEIMSDEKMKSVFFPSHIENSYQISPFEAVENPEIYALDFPVLPDVEKVKLKNLDKNEIVEGEVRGIKGQYLFLDDFAINVRRHEGYLVDVCLRR